MSQKPDQITDTPALSHPQGRTIKFSQTQDKDTTRRKKKTKMLRYGRLTPPFEAGIPNLLRIDEPQLKFHDSYKKPSVGHFHVIKPY